MTIQFTPRLPEVGTALNDETIAQLKVELNKMQMNFDKAMTAIKQLGYNLDDNAVKTYIQFHERKIQNLQAYVNGKPIRTKQQSALYQEVDLAMKQIIKSASMIEEQYEIDLSE